MSQPQGLMYDLGDGQYISVDEARRQALAEKQRQLEIAKMETRWLCERAHADAEFWQHAAIFYDRFFGAITPSYPLTVAAMEHFGYLTPSQRQQLVAHTPGDQRAAAAGMVAGILVAFWLPTKWPGGGTAFKLGTRSHFWTPGASFSLLAADAAKVSKSYGLINLYFKIPGGFEKLYTITNGNVFGLCKFIVGQMFTQVRGAVERSQDQGGKR
jgi:hypothetical protein